MHFHARLILKPIKGMRLFKNTLDLFASDPFKIMLSKGGFLWKL